MRAVDTNVLLRFFTRDDEKQFSLAYRFLTEKCTVENQAYITSIVLVEIVWSLERSYKYDRKKISAALTLLFNSREILIEHQDEAQKANELYLEKTAQGFTDAYTGLIALKHGCSDVVTFDRKATRMDFYQPLSG